MPILRGFSRVLTFNVLVCYGFVYSLLVVKSVVKMSSKNPSIGDGYEGGAFLACFGEGDVDGGVLHFGVDVGLGGDADVTVTKISADKINVLCALIKQGATGVAQLVGG